MIYLAIASIVLIIVVKVIIDNNQISKGKGIAHSKEWTAMALLSLPAIYVFWKESGSILGLISSVFMCMTFIWFFFDGFLNLVRGKGWWYTGVKFSGSAKSDGVLQRFSPIIQKVIKILALLIPISVYMLTLWHGK